MDGDEKLDFAEFRRIMANKFTPSRKGNVSVREDCLMVLSEDLCLKFPFQFALILIVQRSLLMEQREQWSVMDGEC